MTPEWTAIGISSLSFCIALISLAITLRRNWLDRPILKSKATIIWTAVRQNSEPKPDNIRVRINNCGHRPISVIAIWAEFRDGLWKVPHSMEWPLRFEEGEVREIKLDFNQDLLDTNTGAIASNLMIEDGSGRRIQVNNAKAALEKWYAEE